MGLRVIYSINNKQSNLKYCSILVRKAPYTLLHSHQKVDNLSIVNKYFEYSLC